MKMETFECIRNQTPSANNDLEASPQYKRPGHLQSSVQGHLLCFPSPDKLEREIEDADGAKKSEKSRTPC